jgi:hypothetical protein
MTSIHRISIAAATLLLIAGCKKATTDNTSNYKSALDAYYSAHPTCLFNHPQQFPTQVAASDKSKDAPFAALVDQGLLTRTTSEKKKIILSKQEINYDLSDKGRSDWTADANQPGYGNFCFGKRTVASIDNATPNNGQPGATTVVNYHYRFSGAPDWVKNAEIENAFPQVQSDLAGNGTGSATLADTPNGWQVQTPPAGTDSGAGENGSMNSNSNAATPADGRIVK